ncbi:hypothetical protein [Streptomyces sp. SID3212]|nr:hypothetical protein [Streptomyces sp. SID3212]
MLRLAAQEADIVGFPVMSIAYGLTYFSVLETHMADFARVIARLR